MSVDRGDIDRQLRDIGEGEQWWEQREFRELPHILYEDECIQGLVRGKLLGTHKPRVKPARTWLIVVTDKRILCLRQERFARKQIDIGAGQIARIEQGTRMRSYQITVTSVGRRYRIRIPKAEALRFARALTPLVPARSVERRETPDLGPFNAIPGMSTLASLPGMGKLVSNLALTPPEPATRAQIERLEGVVDQLLIDMERIQAQVAFLEKLLHNRVDQDSFIPASPVDS